VSDDEEYRVSSTDSRKWIALVLLCATQFLVVLDVAIVNVALPSIQTALDFSQENLQWVVSAYTLTFGGLLLLGGRMADLLGRRRVFMAGLVVFSLASLACGFAQTDTVLIIARAVQGIGAAIISPAALSILVTTFEEGAERNKALGIWGAIAGIGGAAGVLAGGILTDTLGWEWIFFVNVPIGLAVIALIPRYIDESRAEGATRNFDVAGAVSVTAGLALLVYALVNTDSAGWLSGETIALFGVSIALLVAFVVIELRAAAPLMPLGIFRLRSLTGANIVGLLLGAAVFSVFFFLSLYMQQVLGYSALKSGFAYLLVAVTIILAAGASQALVTRFGTKMILAIGMALLTLGLLYFTQIDVDGSYLVDLVPGFLLVGVGLGFAFVPVSIAALQGVREHEAGVASGLINTSQQIGGALGIAILSTIATTHTEGVLRDAGGGQAAVAGALTEGFQYAFAVGAVMAVVGLIATLLLLNRDDLGHGATEPLPAEAN
jgi:EmrB/QacA subfamily drug resistance transporter